MLYNLRYVLTTAFGEAPYVNWHMFIVAVVGIGQGATSRPAGWLFISNVMLKCYSWLAHGCKIFDPGKDILFPADADMFVDDNTLMHNSPCFDILADELMNQIKADAELWSHLLWVTSRLLEFLKSSYPVVTWSFTDEGKPTITPTLPLNMVRLTDAQGSTIKLKQVAHDVGIEMLGVRKIASLQETTKKEHLHKKTGCYLKAISTCPLQAHEVWISYRAVLNSSITYSLGCTSFMAKDFKSFHKRIMPLLLPRLSYQQHFPCAIVFGTKYHGGIGCTNYSATQLGCKVLSIIKHVRAETRVGKKFLIMIRWAQISAGIRTPILETHTLLPHLE
eukprot:13836253-Ditylum_brightwellii.AAC.1